MTKFSPAYILFLPVVFMLSVQLGRWLFTSVF